MILWDCDVNQSACDSSEPLHVCNDNGPCKLELKRSRREVPSAYFNYWCLLTKPTRVANFIKLQLQTKTRDKYLANLFYAFFHCPQIIRPSTSFLFCAWFIFSIFGHAIRRRLRPYGDLKESHGRFHDSERKDGLKIANLFADSGFG